MREHYRDMPEPERTELRQITRARLERVWQAALRDVITGKSGEVTAAVRVLAEGNRLDRLHAPTEVSIHNPRESQLDARVMGMVALGHPI